MLRSPYRKARQDGMSVTPIPFSANALGRLQRFVPSPS